MIYTHHQSSAARSKKIKHYSDDFSAIDSSLPEISKFFEELNDLIEQGMLKDKLFCIKLSDNAKEASKLNKENDDALYIDKKSLAQAVDNFAKEMKESGHHVDIPVFFYLINFIRKLAIKKWL